MTLTLRLLLVLHNTYSGQISLFDQSSTIPSVASSLPGGAAEKSGAPPLVGGAADSSPSLGGGAAGDSGAVALGRSGLPGLAVGGSLAGDALAGGALAGGALTKHTTADSLISAHALQSALRVKEPGVTGLFGTFKTFSSLMAGSINHVAHTQAEDRARQEAKNSKIEEENAKLKAENAQLRSEMKKDKKSTEKTVKALSIKVDNMGSSKFRENKIGCKVYPLLQRMIDGVVGIAGWVPVDHYTDEDCLLKLVVLSVPVMKYLLVLHDKSLAEVDLDSFLRGAFERYEFPEFSNHKMDIREFVKLLLKTPFKKYQVAPNSPTTQKNNLQNYVIMDQEYWRALLAAIGSEFGDEASGKLSDKALVPDGCMIQDWALTQVSRENPSAEGPSTYIELLGRKLTEEERKACPPMNATWSREAYASMKGFFGMPEGGPRRHVQSGVYDPTNKKRVPTFAQCFKDVSVNALRRADAAADKRKKTSKAPASAVKGKKGKGPAIKGKGKGKAPSSPVKGKAPSSPSKKKRPRSSQEDDEEIDVEGNNTTTNKKKKMKKKKFKKSQS